MATTQGTLDDGILQQWNHLYRNYYQDEIGELLEHYPTEQQHLEIEYGDLFRAFDPDLIDDLIHHPRQILEYADEALRQYDSPIDIELGQANIRVVDLPDTHIYGVGELRSEHAHQYLGVEGNISQVTDVKPKVTTAAFECQKCGTVTRIPQQDTDYQEPHECNGCERQGPFRLNYDKSEFVDRRKVQLKQPPEEAENGQGAHITVYLEGEIADPDGYDLQARVGEHTVIYGILEMDQDNNGRNKTPVFTQYLTGYAFEFERNTDEIDVAEHKDEFEAAANSPNAYQKFFDSLAPDIFPKGRWPLAIRMGTAFLFGGNRVDPQDGSTYRGDVHIGLFGPPGVGKSKFSKNLAKTSPGCEHRSATGLSSGVGLTASATQDDFAEGDGWVLKPGILPRAKEHVILDEADKTDADLSKMNDALEGEQIQSIDKGGIKAKLKTRIGLAINGNPDGGRWDQNAGIKEQVDIPESLWSRFDGIVFLQDQPDESEDTDLAEHVIENYNTNLAREDDGTESESHEPPVSREALRAWVKHAREEYRPKLTEEAGDQLRDYYVEIRTDDSFQENSFPTPRKLETGIRFATAFAKLRLSDVVQPCDVDMAITLSKEILGQALNGEGLDANVFTEAQEQSQQARKERVKESIMDAYKTPQEIAEEVNADVGRVESDLEEWYRRRNPAVVTRNSNGEYRWVK